MLFKSFDIKMLGRTVIDILPAVDEELNHWWNNSRACPNDILRGLAQSSLKHKRFHAQGGAVYALRYGVNKHTLVSVIVALQTISDYLDNLCDRAGCFDERAFRQLHVSMIDALSPENDLQDYYKYYPLKDDGGYLNELVLTCRTGIGSMPSYGLVKKVLIHYIKLYSNLQVYKHVEVEKREVLLKKWIAPLLPNYPGLYWWEFASATGSTLLIFALLSSAVKPDLTKGEIDKIIKVYFPWVCGLHILLDYLIDQEEDILEKDFNFVSCYANNTTVQDRFSFFTGKAIEGSKTLPDSVFHLTIVKGLLALYLSDPKVAKQKIKELSLGLLKEGGTGSFLIYKLCCLFRRIGIV